MARGSRPGSRQSTTLKKAVECFSRGDQCFDNDDPAWRTFDQQGIDICEGATNILRFEGKFPDLPRLSVMFAVALQRAKANTGGESFEEPIEEKVDLDKLGALRDASPDESPFAGRETMGTVCGRNPRSLKWKFFLRVQDNDEHLKSWRMMTPDYLDVCTMVEHTEDTWWKHVFLVGDALQERVLAKHYSDSDRAVPWPTVPAGLLMQQWVDVHSKIRTPRFDIRARVLSNEYDYQVKFFLRLKNTRLWQMAQKGGDYHDKFWDIITSVSRLLRACLSTCFRQGKAKAAFDDSATDNIWVYAATAGPEGPTENEGRALLVFPKIIGDLSAIANVGKNFAIMLSRLCQDENGPLEYPLLKKYLGSVEVPDQGWYEHPLHFSFLYYAQQRPSKSSIIERSPLSYFEVVDGHTIHACHCLVDDINATFDGKDGDSRYDFEMERLTRNPYLVSTLAWHNAKNKDRACANDWIQNYLRVIFDRPEWANGPYLMRQALQMQHWLIVGELPRGNGFVYLSTPKVASAIKVQIFPDEMATPKYVKLMLARGWDKPGDCCFETFFDSDSPPVFSGPMLIDTARWWQVALCLDNYQTMQVMLDVLQLFGVKSTDGQWYQNVPYSGLAPWLQEGGMSVCQIKAFQYGYAKEQYGAVRIILDFEVPDLKEGGTKIVKKEITLGDLMAGKYAADGVWLKPFHVEAEREGKSPRVDEWRSTLNISNFAPPLTATPDIEASWRTAESVAAMREVHAMLGMVLCRDQHGELRPGYNIDLENEEVRSFMLTMTAMIYGEEPLSKAVFLVGPAGAFKTTVIGCFRDIFCSLFQWLSSSVANSDFDLVGALVKVFDDVKGKESMQEAVQNSSVVMANEKYGKVKEARRPSVLYLTNDLSCLNWTGDDFAIFRRGMVYMLTMVLDGKLAKEVLRVLRASNFLGLRTYILDILFSTPDAKNAPIRSNALWLWHACGKVNKGKGIRYPGLPFMAAVYFISGWGFGQPPKFWTNLKEYYIDRGWYNPNATTEALYPNYWLAKVHPDLLLSLLLQWSPPFLPCSLGINCTIKEGRAYISAMMALITKRGSHTKEDKVEAMSKDESIWSEVALGMPKHKKVVALTNDGEKNAELIGEMNENKSLQSKWIPNTRANKATTAALANARDYLRRPGLEYEEAHATDIVSTPELFRAIENITVPDCEGGYNNSCIYSNAELIPGLTVVPRVPEWPISPLHLPQVADDYATTMHTKQYRSATAVEDFRKKLAARVKTVTAKDTQMMDDFNIFEHEPAQLGDPPTPEASPELQRASSTGLSQSQRDDDALADEGFDALDPVSSPRAPVGRGLRDGDFLLGDAEATHADDLTAIKNAKKQVINLEDPSGSDSDSYEYSDDEANRQAQFIHDDSDTEGYPSEFEEGNKKRTVTDNDWSDPESSVRPSKKVRFD